MDKDHLIDLVFRAVPIWDKRHKQHHNRHVLAREWEKISREMNTTGNNARNCWKNQRQEFGKQYKKYQGRSGNAAPDENENQWPYFRKLMFLQDQFTPRDTSSNLEVPATETLTQSEMQGSISDSETSNQSDSFGAVSNITEPSSDLDCAPPTPQSTVHATPSTSTNTSEKDYAVTKTGYKKRTTAQVQIGKQLINLEKEKIALRKEKSTTVNDEDVGFFNSLLPHVKQLSPRDKLTFRMQVQQTLFNLLFPPEETQVKTNVLQNYQQTNLNQESLEESFVFQNL